MVEDGLPFRDRLVALAERVQDDAEVDAGRRTTDTLVADVLDAAVNAAVNDARNRVAGHGDRFVIDATEIWWDQRKDADDTMSVVWVSAHGRVFRCR